ncbi:MAG: PilX N-terminal domain-containing pilus assembly protein [Acidobacteriota bacterium]
MSRSHTLSPRAGRRQRGAAFILVLLALVVLTIFGVALTFITQSELLIGANERLANRAFYTADSGIGIMTARVLVKNDRSPQTIRINSTTLSSANTMVDQIDSSAFLPILDAPCNLCQINNSTSYNANYKRVNNLVASTGSRVGIETGGAQSILAQQILSAMVDIQPTQIDANSINILDQQQQVQQIGKRQ